MPAEECGITEKVNYAEIPLGVRKMLEEGQELKQLEVCNRYLYGLQADQSRIVGGFIAAPGSHPWITSIIYDTGTGAQAAFIELKYFLKILRHP